MNYTHIPLSQALKQLRNIYSILNRQDALTDLSSLRQFTLQKKVRELEEKYGPYVSPNAYYESWFSGKTTVAPPTEQFITTEDGQTITTETGQGITTE